MKRTLRNSKPTQNPNINEIKKAAEQIDPNTIGSVQNVVDKYAGKSESELMNELSAAKQSGAIDPEALASVAGRIAPMLNPEQQQRLQSVLQQLK